ncbi:MAG: biopolymer transporter ExbD [Hoeflea sp.]|uniref:ExbD/TolR family protein n=1 Tax=Hoeflea sp. TaxID=1940281 RepID=UPI0032EF75EF
MIRFTRPPAGKKQESTIALINVVFLMLIFFLVAGSLAPPGDPDVRFISTERSSAAAPPDMLFVASGGQTSWRGEPVEITRALPVWSEEFGEGSGRAFRIAADEGLLATDLVDLVARLRAGGIGEIVLVAERVE